MDNLEQTDEENFYSESELLVYEMIWGKGFISPGGPQEVAEILEGIDLENQRLLDIGCGIGGVDILLVKEFGAAEVVGIDVERPVLKKANLYASEENLSERISFQLVEPGPLPFEGESFDIVFSKDALLHISDKKQLFSEIFRVLNRGGMFVAGDWLGGDVNSPSEHIKQFHKLTDNEFDMVSLGDYETKLLNTGFSDVKLRDRSEWYLVKAQQELEQIKSFKKEIIAEVGLESYNNDWEGFWQVLVEILKTGEFHPTHIRARKVTKGVA